MALLQYDISVINADSVNKALSSIERRVAQHNARIQAASARVGRVERHAVSADARATKEPTGVSAAVATRQRQQAEREAAKAKTLQERQARLAATLEARRQQQVERQAAREKAQQLKLQERQARTAAVAADRQRKQAERRQMIDRAAAERKLASDAKRQERERVGRENAALAEKVRLERYREAVRRNTLHREEVERSRTWAAEERHAQRQALRIAQQRAEFAKATIGNSANRVAGTLRAVGTTGAAMLGIGGAGMAYSAVTGASRLEEASRRLVVSGTGPGETQKYQPEALMRQFVQTGIQTGVNPEDVAAGVQQFVTKVGDLDTAVKNMRVFATTAQATGASVADIASAAADLSEKLDIKSAQDMGKALATLSVQGKKGAFELRDMAQYLPEMAAAASKFGVKGIPGITALGGIAQIARRATGTGAEAATSVEAMFRQLTAKSPAMQSGQAFSGRKVQIFAATKEHPEGDPTKGMRDFREIVADVITASRGNLVQLQEVFDIRGIRAVNPLITVFRDAAEKAGGGEKGAKAGRAAVMEEISRASDVGASFGDIEKDASKTMKSFSVQMEIFQTRVKAAVASQVFPILADLAPKLGELVPYIAQATKAFVDLVKWISDHPKASIAMLIGGQIAADFTRARLGSLVSNLIERAFQGKRVAAVAGVTGVAGGAGGIGGPGSVGGVGGAGGAGGPGGPGFLGRPAAGAIGGAALTGLAAGISIATGIFTVGVATFQVSEAKMKAAGEKLQEVREAGVEDIQKVRETVRETETKLTEEKRGGTIQGAATVGVQAVGWFAHHIPLLGSIMPTPTAEQESIAGRRAAEFVGAESKETVNTIDSFLAEMKDRLSKLELLQKAAEDMRKAGVDQNEAAAKLAAAAEKLGVPAPNRGSAPSPIKG